MLRERRIIMKLILLGDCHLGARQNSQIIANHQIKLFDQLIDYCKDNDIKTIIQLGDVYDQRKAINVKTLKLAYELFDRFEEGGIDFHTLIGNHDVFYKDTIEVTSSSLLLRSYNHVHVYDKPTKLQFGSLNFDIIPWICDDNRELCLDTIKNSTSDICCGHFEINQFPIRYQTNFEGGLAREQFKHYKHVFSGHFHQTSEKDNITYVGTPYQLTWSDALSTNGFWVLDTETLEYQHVINNDKYFRYLHYNDSVPGITTKISKLDLKDTFIKILVEKKTKPLLYERFVTRIFDNNPADVKIIDQELQVDEESNVNVDLKTMNTFDIINNYIDNCSLTNKQELKNLMFSLYNESLDQTQLGV